jgi:dolichol-phosphate mannosyltransferase
MIAGISGYIALFFAIILAILNNFIWNDLWTFSDSARRMVTSSWERLRLFYIVSAGGAVINYGVAILLTYSVGMKIDLADLIGILIGFIWNFLINRRYTWGRK